MKLSIIIVSWNVRELLLSCLRSLQTYGLDDMEIFVVDNASMDGTQREISKYRNIEIIQNNVNRGFAAANNQAMREAKGEYTLLLNPDTEITEGALERMIAFMESHPRCGILGPKLLNSDGTLQPSIRRFPGALAPIALSLGFQPKQYLALDGDYTKEQSVDQVMGAAFCIRRELVQEIGLLDEKFFIWFEEVDYCKRAKEKGWDVWYTPTASIIHHGGQSFAQALTLQKQWWYTQSLLHYFWKHRAYSAYCINLLTIPFRLLLSWVKR